MLTDLLIRNLAIVDRLDVSFPSAMTSLTGETGAGKSILIGALGLALGQRADSDVIRSGQARAEISALFDLEDAPEAARWLQEQALDDGGSCILRRVLVREGSSRAFINGSPVPARSLQTLGALLVDIHGQHSQQSLLHRDQQARLLDAYAGLEQPVAQIRGLFREWRQAELELEQRRTSSGERRQRLELLHYQIDELTQLAVTPEEVEQLDREQRRLSHATELRQQCGRLLELLDEDEASARARVTAANRELEQMLALDPGLAEARELLESAAIQIDEAIAGLQHYADAIEIDPEGLERVERRLQAVHDQARKYQCRPQELAGRLQSLERELTEIENSGQQLQQLEEKVAQLSGRYRDQAAKLSEQRRAAAERLSWEASDGIRSLGIPDGRLAIEVGTREEQRPGPDGMDRIEFLVSANPGQPLRPLKKVASGGELSRISLAIQVATIGCGRIPTLIFDEVDVGIGGAVAEIVGRLLRQLGDQRQVLCVTHLPQVAAQGHQQMSVTKQTRGRQTSTRIQLLQGEERVNEVARMLGGVEITANTLAHAREMIGP